MTRPIAATPVLEGEDARTVLDAMKPGYKLPELNRQMLERAWNSRKEAEVLKGPITR